MCNLSVPYWLSANVSIFICYIIKLAKIPQISYFNFSISQKFSVGASIFHPKF